MAKSRKENINGLTLHKRTEEEEVRDQVIIANMMFQGVKLTEMSEKLQERTGAKYQLSISSIDKESRNLIIKWREKNLFKVDEIKNRELLKLDALEDEYWRAWHRSCLPRNETIKKQERGVTLQGAEVDAKGHVLPRMTATMIETEIRTGEYTRDGSSKFLEGIERCINQRCKLLGLFSPIKISNPLEDGNTYDLPIDEVHKRLIAVVTNIQINVNGGKDGS